MPERRGAAKLLGFAAHACAGLAIVTLVFPFASAARRRRLTQRWSRSLLAAIGVRLHASGHPRGAAMMVANHVSWLDVIAMSALAPATFVAKSELRRWPVAGTVIRGVGSIFIERRRKRDILRVNAALRARLAGGGSVAVFPEGTTTDGLTVAPFRNALLQAAVDGGTPVQPVAIAYLCVRGRRTTEAAYCGETSFWESLIAVASSPGLAAHLHFDLPIDTRGLCRRRAGALARERILHLLDQPHGHREAAAFAERARLAALGAPGGFDALEQLADLPEP